MKTKITLADQDHCTGCGACANSCPKNAISMIPDKEGFIQPIIDENKCIECHICEKTCPVFHPQYKNKEIDSCYAMWADDELRRITSTAGFFLLMAKDVLKKGGIVFGAAWQEGWKVAHIGVEKEEDLSLICGSKYLQSDAKFSYKEAKRNLDAGRTVLFSGCPCHIAGLYATLHGKTYENLQTVEVLCHGVPSPEAFQEYLKDNYSDKVIKSINFRDKEKMGWRSSCTIHFDSGEIHRENELKDHYYRAFLPCMILRRSCAICPFSRLPRQADITIGDFWGIKKEDSTWHDKKGTELVLVNNEKGQSIFNSLKTSFQRYESFPLSAATRINKTIIHPFNAHPGRKHFFSAMGKIPFNKLVEKSLEHKYDVGVVGLWYGINYGSVLTYYALYKLVESLGYDAVMIPKPSNLWDDKFNNPNTIAQSFIWKHCNVFNNVASVGEINRMNDNCSTFVLGSDVVWNYKICGKDVDQFFFLDWVESGHKKIAFASSLGNTLSGSESYVQKAKYNLKHFDAISLREDSGVETIKEMTNREDIVQVLDPVFLCDRSIYDEVAIEKHNHNNSKPYIFAYLLKPSNSDEKKNILNTLKEEFSLDAKVCGNPNSLSISKEYYGDDILPEISIEQWISEIKNCEMYIGDSYHGMCFAIIYHKPFIITYGQKSSKTSHQRFESLLRVCELEDRILFGKELTTEAARKIYNTPIDWDNVEKRLDALRSKSRDWLAEKLALNPKTQTLEDYINDAQKRVISEQRVELDLLRDRIAHLEEQNHKPNFKTNCRIAFDYFKRNGFVQTCKKILNKIFMI